MMRSAKLVQAIQAGNLATSDQRKLVDSPKTSMDVLQQLALSPHTDGEVLARLMPLFPNDVVDNFSFTLYTMSGPSTDRLRELLLNGAGKKDLRWLNQPLGERAINVLRSIGCLDIPCSVDPDLFKRLLDEATPDNVFDLRRPIDIHSRFIQKVVRTGDVSQRTRDIIDRAYRADPAGAKLNYSVAFRYIQKPSDMDEQGSRYGHHLRALYDLALSCGHAGIPKFLRAAVQCRFWRGRVVLTAEEVRNAQDRQVDEGQAR